MSSLPAATIVGPHFTLNEFTGGTNPPPEPPEPPVAPAPVPPVPGDPPGPPFPAAPPPVPLLPQARAKTNSKVPRPRGFMSILAS
ncbi:MAG: hypothetical protein E4H00_10085 [Myxococcales bacterium]|nr:MAG: hypothetical protein E4H00_10085 [Myxococcales bacterium]